MKERCIICSGKMTALTPKNPVTANSRLDWLSDSTFTLLGEDLINVQAAICLRCFHSQIFPRFDASRLYGEKASSARKEAYERYNPGSIYYGPVDSCCLKTAFEQISNEYGRYNKLFRYLSRRVTSDRRPPEIRILDWGGSDGFVSSTIAHFLKTVCGVNVTNCVYDYVEARVEHGQRMEVAELSKVEKFDILLLCHVLEHCDNPVATVRQAAAFLKPKGLVIVEVPDELLNVVRAIMTRKQSLGYHVCSFSRTSLVTCLQEAGLSKVSGRYVRGSSYRGGRMDVITASAVFDDRHDHRSLYLWSKVCDITHVLLQLVRKISSICCRKLARHVLNTSARRGASPYR
jgi:hypothetical protein